MVLQQARLWMRSGQLGSPQRVDGKKSPNLWRVAVTRQVIEQRVAGGSGGGAAAGPRTARLGATKGAPGHDEGRPRISSGGALGAVDGAVSRS